MLLIHPNAPCVQLSLVASVFSMHPSSFVPIRIFAALVLVVSHAIIHGQSTPTRETPTNPQEQMLAAVRLNNLTGPDVKPWHIKATYRLLDDKGSVADEGVYEELWAGPVKSKRTFTGKSFTQTDYLTSGGMFRSGPHEDVSQLLFDLRRELVTPLFSVGFKNGEPYISKPVDVNGMKLLCLQVNMLPSNGILNCVSIDKPILRISVYASDHLQILHNRILNYQNNYLAGDLKIVRDEKPVLIASVEQIEPLEPLNDSDFTPSPDAVAQPRRINISAGVAVGMLQSHTAPVYPQSALAARISGTVALEAFINVDGTIKDLHVVQGPPELRQAALDAVRTWRYRPYLLNGIPVEVKTSVNVVFTLGH